MKRIQVTGILIALLLAILIFAPVTAGGWAVITLDELPDEIALNRSVEIGFIVRQHGITPMADLTPSVTATHIQTGQTFRTEALAQGPVGHYVAELEFPQAGSWDWSIQAFTMDQSLPPLWVTMATEETRAEAPIRLSPFWGFGVGLLAGIAALLLFIRKRARWAVALLVLALFFTGGSFVLAANKPPETRMDADVRAADSRTDQGKALFVSKGCITCHTHVGVVAKFDVIGGISAPDLSDIALNPAYLRRWLANPGDVKPGTAMPDLGLTSEEIEALTTFLAAASVSAVDQAFPADVPPSCPVTQPPDPQFTPLPPYPAETATEDEFWYGADDLWTMLPVNGAWRSLPYHEDKDGSTHYVNKVFWWNKDYDWQAEPVPSFKVTALRLDDPAFAFETSEPTNAYTPEFGSAILTGVEIPTPGCWAFTGHYRGHSLRFVVWVAP
jgi:mono/diheme cytochrome c family protein